jgi:hypothetical protein
LHGPPPTTLRNYYNNFKSISGGLAAAIGILPVVSSVFTGAAHAYFFPPLGDITTPARIGVVVVAVAVTYICFYSAPPPRKFGRFALILTVSLLAFLCYLLSLMHLVRKITIPATDSETFVSIGYERTPFAVQTFGSETDWDMLQARGTSDEEVFRLWTARSVDIARLWLIVSYSVFVLSLVLIFSLGVRYQI